MVTELLEIGTDNARSGRELAKVLKCDIREVTAQIERERRAGQPICASMGGNKAGYYLAESPEELENYCNMLYHRAGALFKTRRALLNVLEQIKKQKEA